MKKTLIAMLASLMLAGILAGATEPVETIASSVFALGGRSPILVNAPIIASFGDSLSR